MSDPGTSSGGFAPPRETGRRLVAKKLDFVFLSWIHGSFSVLFVSSFALVAWEFASLMIFMTGSEMRVPLWVPILFAVFASIAEIVFTALFPRRRINAGARWRFILISLVVAYAAASPFRLGPFLLRFVPGLENIALTVFVLFVLGGMGGSHQLFLIREELIQTFDGLSGDRLLLKLQEEHPTIFMAYRTVISSNRGCITGIFIVVLLNIVVWIVQLGSPLSPAFAILSGFAVVSGLLGLAIGNSYLDDHRSLIKTSLQSLPQRVSRIVLSLAIIAVGITVGALVNSGTSLLPTELIVRFFTWIAGLFAPSYDERIFDDLRQIYSQYPAASVPPEVQAMMTDPGTDYSHIWAIVFDVIKYFILISASLSLVFFLIYPLFKKGSLKGWLEKVKKARFPRILRRFLARIALFFRAFRRMWAQLFKTGTSNAGSGSISGDEYLDHYLRELKESSRGPVVFPSRFVRLFQRFVAHAEKLGTVFMKHLTLRDIVTDAAGKQPLFDVRGPGLEVCSVLETILYDTRNQRKPEMSNAILDSLEKKISIWEALEPVTGEDE